MGHVFADAYVEGLKSGEKVKMLVDTGATLTMIPRDLAERLGVPTLKPRRVGLADGREIEAEAGLVSIEIDGREAPATVLVMGREPSLGVETLEILGLRVNPQTGELEPTRSYTIRA
jgi:clan AA aspartic protease